MLQTAVALTFLLLTGLEGLVPLGTEITKHWRRAAGNDFVLKRN